MFARRWPPTRWSMASNRAARCWRPSPNTSMNRDWRSAASRWRRCSRQARWTFERHPKNKHHEETTMLTRRILLSAAAALGVPMRGAFAQAYPNRTIRIIVPTPAGGPVDTIARVVANALPPILGQPVVVENRAGAGNTIGSNAAAAADPDGYTLIYTAASGLVMNPMLPSNAGYSAPDFAPIAIRSQQPI